MNSASNNLDPLPTEPTAAVPESPTPIDSGATESMSLPTPVAALLDLDEDEDDDTDLPATVINPPPAIEEGDDMPTIVLPMQLVDLASSSLTDVGQQREHNEDYFGVALVLDEQRNPLSARVRAKGLYILCDGMGGHAGGEVASRMAVESLQQTLRSQWLDQDLWTLPDREAIVAAIHQANQTLYDQNLEAARLGNGRMGTTLVMLLLCGNQVAIAHVGDSRAYSVNRKQGLVQLTTDHEVGQREIQRGSSPEEAYARPDAYQLTQALGPRDNQFVDPGVAVMELTEDTLFLLASDGLTDNDLLEQCWPTVMEPMLLGQLGLEPGVQQLIGVANQYNGHDNITAIAVRLRVRPEMLSGI